MNWHKDRSLFAKTIPDLKFPDVHKYTLPSIWRQQAASIVEKVKTRLPPRFNHIIERVRKPFFYTRPTAPSAHKCNLQITGQLFISPASACSNHHWAEDSRKMAELMHELMTQNSIISHFSRGDNIFFKYV